MWLVSSAIIVGIAFKRPAGTHARTFCAFGKVFVEFEERNRTWGVLMLNDSGVPILCGEDAEEIIKNTKETI